MSQEKKKGGEKLEKVREKLPNVNKYIFSYLQENNIKGAGFEESTGFGKSYKTMISKSGVRAYMDVVYLFSIVFRKNFFGPTLKELYSECPECIKEDPLYNRLKEAESKVKRYEKLLADNGIEYK